MTSFLSSTAQTNIGTISAVEDSVEGLWQTEPSIKTQLLFNDSIIQSIDSIYYLNDSLMHTGLSFNDSLTLATTDSLLAVSVSSYAHINDSLASLIDVSQQSRIASALSMNASISSPSTVEWAEQNVNEIYLETIAGGVNSFNTTQLSTLRSIANQCPFVYGAAVFKARSLLALVDTTVYDDSTLCHPQARKMQIIQPYVSNESVSVSLYPKPTTGEVTVLYQLNKTEGLLELFDVVGKKVGSFVLPAYKTKFEFNIGDLCCGMFEFRISDSNGTSKHGKLVVIR